MSLSIAQIEHEVDLLPQNDIEELFEYIFKRRVLTEHDKIWGEEASRRLKAYQAGRTTARPAEDVIRDLKAKFS